MTPQFVVNEGLYYDRTVQEWHRRFPPEWSAIDIDLMGACKRCGRSLYLIESTTNPRKSTQILRRLAEDAGTAALLVLHKHGSILGGRVIYWPAEPSFKPVLRSEASVVRILQELRKHHRCG